MAIGFVGALEAGAGDSFINIQPSQNTRQQNSALRVEGGKNVNDNLSLYGFADLDAAKEGDVDVENIFLKGRVDYNVKGPLGLAADYTGGNNLDDRVRAGITLTPKTWKGNFTQFTLFPYDSETDNGTQAVVFGSQKLGKRVIASVLADYDLESKGFYLEPNVDVKLTDKVSAFAQGRAFGDVGEYKGALKDMATYVGFKIDF